MKVLSLLFAAFVAAQNVAVHYTAPTSLTNEVNVPLDFAIANNDFESAVVKKVTAVIRTTGAKNKGYLNLTQALDVEILPGATSQVVVDRQYSLPTKEWMIEFVFDIVSGNRNHQITTGMSPVKVVDPSIQLWEPRFILGVAVILTFIVLAGWLASEYIPAVGEALLKVRPAPAPASKAARPVREASPSNPEDWLPERHRRKVKQQ